MSNFATPWTPAGQTPLSMESSGQEYWSGLSFSSPGDLPDPGIKLEFPAMCADSLLPELPGKLRRIEVLDKGISGAQSLK